MQVATFEAVVENGQIRLKSDIALPENMLVYVFVPDFKMPDVVPVHIYSPRLVYPEQIADFTKEIIEESPHAEI